MHPHLGTYSLRIAELLRCSYSPEGTDCEHPTFVRQYVWSRSAVLSFFCCGFAGSGFWTEQPWRGRAWTGLHT